MKLQTARLRSVFAAVKERIRLPFSMRSQTYSVEYQVSARNNSPSTQSVTVVLPYPIQARSQEIVGNVTCSEPVNVCQDQLYANRYGLVEVDIKPGEQRAMTVRFACRVSQVRVDTTRFVASEGYDAIERDLFLRYSVPNRFIRSDLPEIQQLASELKTKGRDVIGTLREINEFVIHRLTYGKPIAGLYTTEQALRAAAVDCGGFDTLYCALAIAAGIPSRVVSGFWAGYSKNMMHAWAESLLPDGTWLPVDPSVEQLRRLGRTAKSGRFGFVGSDRIALSYQCDIPIQIADKQLTVDLLQNPSVLLVSSESSQIQTDVVFIANRV